MTVDLLADVSTAVRRALDEDVGSGDLTAALIPPQQHARARVITRETAVVCGRPWVDEVFAQIDSQVRLDWLVNEGARVAPDQTLFTLAGPARSLLTGERTALNFLQALSGTATEVARYVEAVRGTAAQIVDTRKTLPGLRLAQKYAVVIGGGVNHRIGLYDGILIKENHIAAAGGIAAAITAARALKAGVPVMAEAETVDEARIALLMDVDLLLVDDFTPVELREAVQLTHAHRRAGGRTLIEYSGGASLERIRALADSGVDRISVGSLTKHVRAIDLSMRLS